ncbi:unnamed protein product, partial [Chrysoparadoxa australica]
TVDDLVSSVKGFNAVLRPVALCLVFSAVVASLITTKTTRMEQSAGLSVYEFYSESDADSDEGISLTFGKSIVNASLIVAVLGCGTFGIVLLYKLKYMKCLRGYMIMSSTMLLGYLGGLVWRTAVEKWGLAVDYLTFVIACWNFAVVGVIAIFRSGKGVPPSVTQGYLIFTSVIMAWQLSRFDEWTGWSLLVCLSLYDLFAVLSPYGPLRALVSLMQEYEEPLPGLLYEAQVGEAPAQTHSYRGIDQARDGDGEDESLQGLRLDALAMHITARPAIRPRRGGRARALSAPSPSRPSYPWEEEAMEKAVTAEPETVKLGLGDFAFFSTLCTKAALYGYTCCVACIIAVLFGLGCTLGLLSLHKMALPALPISIFLGVSFYLLSRWSLEPYVLAM